MRTGCNRRPPRPKMRVVHMSRPDTSRVCGSRAPTGSQLTSLCVDFPDCWPNYHDLALRFRADLAGYPKHRPTTHNGSRPLYRPVGLGSIDQWSGGIGAVRGLCRCARAASCTLRMNGMRSNAIPVRTQGAVEVRRSHVRSAIGVRTGSAGDAALDEAPDRAERPSRTRVSGPLRRLWTPSAGCRSTRRYPANGWALARDEIVLLRLCAGRQERGVVRA